MRMNFTGKCRICGRELTNGEHVSRGVGPVCAGREGQASAAAAFPGTAGLSELMLLTALDSYLHSLLQTSYWAGVRFEETGDRRYERLRDAFWSKYQARQAKAKTPGAKRPPAHGEIRWESEAA
jgi:hypothetical protein